MSNPDPQPIPRIRLSDPKPLPYQAPQLETWPRPPHVGMFLIQHAEKNYRLGVWTEAEWAALDPIDREAMRRDVSSLSGLGKFLLRPIPDALYVDTVREALGLVVVEEDREPAPPAGRAQSTPIPFTWEGDDEDDDDDEDEDDDDDDEDEDEADDAPTGAGSEAARDASSPVPAPPVPGEDTVPLHFKILYRTDGGELIEATVIVEPASFPAPSGDWVVRPLGEWVVRVAHIG